MRLSPGIMGAAALALLLVGPAITAQAPAQPGFRPGGSGDEGLGMWRGPAPPPLWVSDDEYLRWALPPGEQAYASLDAKRIKAYIREITGFSRQSRDAGDQFWGRITGTKYDKMTTDWVAAQFKRIGLEKVRIQEFDLPPQWFPTSWAVTVTGKAKSVDIKTAMPLYHSVGMKPSEVEPVWVGLGTAADYKNVNVKGKIPVVYGIPTPGGRSDSALNNGSVKRAEEQGAAAIFVIMGVPGNVTNEPIAGGSTDPAGIPVFMIGSDDGNAIREMIEKDEAPKISVRLTVELKTGLKTASVFGELPGMTDENVAVMAHTEAFFEGAMDNASGMGTMLELAQFYASKPKAERRRTMTFFTSSAHHAPTGETGGIKWIHNNMQAMFAKTALILNCEHPSQVQTYLVGNGLVASNAVSAKRWFVGGSDELKAIATRAFKTFGVSTYSRMETTPGGELSQVFRDAPSVHVIDHMIYHSDLDRPELVPEAGLEASVRAFAKIIDEVNKIDLGRLRVNIPK